MKSLFSKLRRKLGVSPEAPTHPDLNPPSDWGGPEAEYMPSAAKAEARSEPDESAADPRQVIEGSIHPDLLLIEPQILAEDPSGNPHAEAPIQSEFPVSGRQASTAEAVTEFEADNDVSANHEPDPDPALAPPNPDFSRLSADLELVEADDEYDELIGDDDVFDDQADDLWEAVLSYDVDEEIERARANGDLFEVSDFHKFQEFGPGEIERETESAQWEDLSTLR